MNTEHIYDRYDRTTRAAQLAEKEADDIIAPFRRAAEMLKDWKNVGFAGTTSGGDFVDTLGASQLIRFEEVPAIRQIFEAVQKWQRCESERRAALQNMTAEQRQKVGQG
jgi:hypothetical protein